MIVLNEKKDNINIIHLIIGPETEFQFDFSGQCVIDVTEQIKKVAENESVLIVINRCNDEMELALELNRRNEQSMHEQNMKKFVEFNLNKSEFNSEHKEKKSKKEKPISLKCPKCHATDSGILKDGLVHPCQSCQTIEDGLKKDGTNAPESLDPEKSEQIIKEIEKQSPHHKSFIKKLFNKKDKNNEELPPDNESDNK